MVLHSGRRIRFAAEAIQKEGCSCLSGKIGPDVISCTSVTEESDWW